MRYQARLILSKYYSVDLLLGFGTQPQNTCFKAYLILPDHQGSCNLSKISRIIYLLYCDQQHFHLSHIKCFWLLPWCYSSVWNQSISTWIRLCKTFIYAAFKSHTKWSNAQHVITPTTMGTYYGLKCFSHVIYEDH